MLDVLWEDNHLIFINKPSGVPVQGDSSGDRHLQDMVEEYIRVKYQKPGAAFVGLVHRIDRPVSGVVVMAKSSKALTRLNEIFKEKTNTKIYHLLTENRMDDDEGSLFNYIAKDGRINRAHVYTRPRTGSKEAHLSYKLLANYGGKNLYEVKLQTGRFHQIRAQFGHMGCPILGDVKYGAKNPLRGRAIALHARTLITPHIVKDKPEIRVSAPYPKEQWWQLFKDPLKQGPRKYRRS